jgi:hypothetical protein
LLAAASMAGAVGGVSPSAGAGEVLHLLLGEGLRNREWRLADLVRGRHRRAPL